MTRAGLLLAALEPTREQARDAARRELLRAEYGEAQPPLVVRVVSRVLQELEELLARASSQLASPVARVLLVAVLAGLAVAVLVRLGPARSRERAGGAVFDAAATRTAAAHRQAAEEAAEQHRWADAVRERLRALVRELEERGVLDRRPSRTASEVARDGGTAVPPLAGDLQRAARTFDEVWYGGREAGPEAYAVVAEVDDRMRSAAVPAGSAAAAGT